MNAARDLGELARRASDLGLDALLALPIDSWLEGSALQPEVKKELRRLARSVPCDTVGELFRRPTGRMMLQMGLGRSGIGQIHADALQRFRAALAGGPGSPVPAAATGEPADGDGLAPAMDSEALRAWAERNGVASALHFPTECLRDRLAGTALAWLWYGSARSLGSVISAPTGRGIGYDARHAPKAVQEAAIAELKARAREAKEGIAEEAARPPLQDPADPQLRAAFERVLAARRALRGQASPRPRARIGPISLDVELDPPTLIYREAAKAWCGGGSSPVVRVDPGRGPGAEVASCSCPRGRGECPVVLSALDCALEAMSTPSTDPAAQAFRDAIRRPAWERTLVALDQALGRGAAPAGRLEPEEALGWRILESSRGRLDLEPVLCRPYKRGIGLKSRRIRLEEVRDLPPDACDDRDHGIATLLEPDPRYRTYGTHDPAAPAQVHRAIAMLVGHPRVLMGPRASTPMSVRRARLQVRWIAEEGGGARLVPCVDAVRMDVAELADQVQRRGAGGWLVLFDNGADVCRVAAVPPRLPALLGTLASRGASFPAEALPGLMDRIPDFTRAVPIALDAALRGEEVPCDGRPVLRIAVLPGEAIRIEAWVRPLPDAAAWPPGEGPEEVLAIRETGRVFCRRDLEGEGERSREALARIGLPDGAEVAPFRWMIGDPDEALEVLGRVQAAGDGIAVEWEGPERRTVTRPAGARDLRVAVQSAREWFGVSGGLSVDGVEVPLLDLLEAARQDRRFVRVQGGTWVRLTRTLKDQLAPLACSVSEVRGKLQLSPLHVPSVAGLAEAGAAIEAPARWATLLERIRDADGADASPPSGLRGDLRPYQQDGQAWLARLATWAPGACLADDMGLGKTVQALALLLRRADLGPALVVAPTSVGFNWVRECERFAPSLRPVLLRGPARGALLEAAGPGDVLVTSYGLLLRDAEALGARRYATLVLDEAHAVKNPDAQRSRAARAIEADFRLALTGTPIENRLGELWSLFHTIAPGLLGSWEHFRTRFAVPVERLADERRRGALARMVRPFLLRRTKAEVAPELPPRTEITVEVPLSPPERALYDQVRLAALAGLEAGQAATPETRRFQVLAALTRLRQLACHPRLFLESSSVSSSKLKELRGLVDALRQEGHRALIFSQFTRLLALVREALDADGISYRYLDGATPEIQRRAEVDAFQAGEADVFLISLQAGGTGLNLTAASYVIHLDPWWNPAVEDQATGRTHRIGQERPVTVYRLIAKGTVEDAILSLQARKRELVAGILDGTAGAAALSTDDLLALLQSGMGGEDGEDGDGDDEPDSGPPRGGDSPRTAAARLR
ncbi:DEAD/DEAH box helicase [Myxococcota bacterium]|nr:DEAD/DEAH box helicase [Myxococcota bacterium]